MKNSHSAITYAQAVIIAISSQSLLAGTFAEELSGVTVRHIDSAVNAGFCTTYFELSSYNELTAIKINLNAVSPTGKIIARGVIETGRFGGSSPALNEDKILTTLEESYLDENTQYCTMPNVKLKITSAFAIFDGRKVNLLKLKKISGHNYFPTPLIIEP